MAKPVFSKAQLKEFAKTKAIKAGMQQRIAVMRLTGDKSLVEMLDTVAPAKARQGMRTGLAKAMRLLAKQMKAQVPTDKKRLKVLIASRAEGTKKDAFAAKSGAGVGDAYKKVAKRGAKKQGVGISGANVHWLMAGTKQRNTKKDSNRGKLPASASSDAAKYQKIVPDGFAAGKDAAAALIRTEITKTLEKAKAKDGK